MRGLGPADIEPFFEINCIVFCCLQNSLAIVRMNGYLIACKNAGPDPGSRGAESVFVWSQTIRSIAVPAERYPQ
jgi:hypothetical protein